MKGNTSARYDSLVFDLDGTLWDTCDACALAWNNVIKSEGIAFRTIVANDVRAVTGRPHDECIRHTFVDLPENQIRKISELTIVEDIRVISEIGGILYPGVKQGLAKLGERHGLYIVSNCQSGYIEMFLALNHFERTFRDFECWGNTRLSKGKNLQTLIDRNELASPLMIGDTEGDRDAAKECGIPFAFVTYGFGRCNEPDQSFASFDELVDFLMMAT